MDWEETTKQVGWELGHITPVYTDCCAADFYQVYSWAVAEPDKSMDFAVVCTAANRVREGLNLISNVSHPGLGVHDEDVLNFALNVYLSAHKVSRLVAMLEEKKEELTGGESNFMTMFRSVVKGIAVIATGGLAIPAAALLGWLMATKPNLAIVIPPSGGPVKREFVGFSDKVDRKVENEAIVVPATPVVGGLGSCMV
jgi:hypothetical protein